MKTQIGMAAYEVALQKFNDEMSLKNEDSTYTLQFNLSNIAHNYADNWSLRMIEKFEQKLEKAFKKIAKNNNLAFHSEIRDITSIPTFFHKYGYFQTYVTLW